jgi:hypothetical protein
MILPVMANRIRARTQIFKAMPEVGITERYRLKLSIESPRLKTRGVSKSNEVLIPRWPPGNEKLKTRKTN